MFALIGIAFRVQIYTHTSPAFFPKIFICTIPVHVLFSLRFECEIVAMDLNEFRSMILDSGLDIWGLIDMAITLASSDHENDLKQRRDGIVQRLYATQVSGCVNCNEKLLSEGRRRKEKKNGEGDEKKILEIKILLDDQSQSERSLIELLQKLVDMDTSFNALKSTDIGRHVSKLRKHSSTEVRKLVKILIRKWKDTVDEWVRLNTQTEHATPLDDDETTNEPHYESFHNVHLTPIKIESDHKPPSANKHPLDQTQHVDAKKQKTARALHFNSFKQIL